MSLSDSMFLFEITIDELKSIFNYKDYSILGHFADVFHVYLKDVNDFETALSKKPKKKLTKKSKVRDIKNAKIATMSKVSITRSVLIAHDNEILKERMKNYPLELSFRSKYNSEVILASNQIPWSHNFIDFLNEIETKGLILPVIVENKYSLFHEYTSKRVATIKLSIKLSFLMDKLCTQIQYPYTSNFETTKVLSTTNERCLTDETGIIKTTCAGRKSKPKHTHGSHLLTKTYNSFLTNDKSEICHNEYIEFERNNKCRNKIISLVKSHNDKEIKTKPSIIKSQSCCSLEYTKPLNILNYIFGNNNGPFGNRVYCVGYFSVQNESVKKLASPKVSSKDNKSSENSTALKEKYHFSLCDAECPSKKASVYSCQSHCSLDLPKDAEHLISVKHCNRLDCDAAKTREPPNAPDERLMINLTSIKRDSYIISEKVEQVVGGMTAKMKMGPRPCYCSCECTFGFTKKTTYCNICGGVENFGEEQLGSLAFPCPIYHKLVDKNKLKTVSSGSDSKKKGSKHTNPFGDKNDESEKDNKKGKTKKKDDRFKFNYGYTAPQIGHSQCAMSCKGTLGSVPKNMGWLWTAEDIPGMRFRPMWKPGAVNKYVVRLLKIAKNPDEAIAKKRKRELKKKPLKRPLLIVHKKDGEFTVTMETMKAYSKQRAINQQPYEEKPLVTYTIGRSEEENRERLKKKERIQRRFERAQRDFIQNTFKDICKEICLKTYQQALGILPDTEDPECVCYPAEPGPDKTNMNRSCSCSEDSASDSDTDSDEWVVEFTPPNAYFDPTYKGKKVLKVEKETQYTYLDYRVKLVDRYGNPVPRFFKGPDGKQQCSDLGGFWSPEHEWLEINVDGYIAPDNRWAPMSFTGPNGEQIDTEEGIFQAANGKWLVVGVDGYIDNHGKWRFYSRPRASPARKRIRAASKKVVNKPEVVQSETTWSCFGDASPKHLSKMGIIGHGINRKLLAATLKEMLARGDDVTLPKPSVVPRLPDSKKRHSPRFHQTNYSEERTQCRHPVPSAKGVVAVNAYGNKTYFKLKDHKNKRPDERIATLNEQGISLSSFHVPCFHSFINNEIMKQEQQERIIALAGQSKSIATQA